MSIDPVSAIAAGATTSIKILEVTYLLKAVDEQTADLLKTTQHVDSNVNEARRLRRQKDALLNSDDRSWMDSRIAETMDALREIQKLIDPARVSTATVKGIPLKERVLWVFRDSPKVRDKHNHLSTCHQSLIGLITILHSKDVVVVAPMPTVNVGGGGQEQQQQQPPPYTAEMQTLFRDRKRRKSSNTLRDNASVRSAPLPVTQSPFSPPLGSYNPPTPTLELDHIPPFQNTTNRPSSALGIEASMSANAVPSSLYSTLDGLDGLQVRDIETQRTPPPLSPSLLSPTSWTPVNFPIPTSTSAYDLPSTNMGEGAYTSGPLVDVSDPSAAGQESERNTQGAAAGAGLDYIMAGRQRLGQSGQGQGQEQGNMGRSTGRTKGREWLACYAARSDIGHQYGGAGMGHR